MHDDEVAIDTPTARALIAAQFPQWRDLPVTPVISAGTVTVIFRLGDRLGVKFPRRRADLTAARRAMQREAAALTEFSAVCPFLTPRPVAIGRPTGNYPLPWLVQTWVPGDVATPVSAATSTTLALDLADLIRAMRDAPIRGRRFRGHGRGGNLRDHDRWVQHCLTQVAPLLNPQPLQHRWERFRNLPPSRPHVMTHSDLTPYNLVVEGDQLRGVLDAGWFGPADPSLDLVCAWHLLDTPARTTLRTALSAGPVEWARGAAWAFEQALGLVWYYRATNSRMAELGNTTLHRILTATDIPTL